MWSRQKKFSSNQKKKFFRYDGNKSRARESQVVQGSCEPKYNLLPNENADVCNNCPILFTISNSSSVTILP